MNAEAIRIESEDRGNGADLRLRGVTPSERFWDMVRYVGASDEDCWLWGGCVQSAGYGQFGLSQPKRIVLAHRFAYEDRIGPIPAELQLDHLCRTSACVNPAHLEPVTSYENSIRGEHPQFVSHRTGICKRGHVFTPGSLNKRGKCRQCNIDYCKEWRRRYAC